jgi:Tat protein translocase TatB subunit
VLNLGTGEVLVILVVALVVLGPDKLPGAARQAGRWLGDLRRLSSGFQAELRDALQEPVDQTPRSTTTTTAVPPPKDEPEPDPGPG